MTHPFLALTDDDREEMLRTIGVSSVAELFRDVPAGVRLDRELDLEPALSEQELSAHLAALAARNADTTSELSFLGAGIYDHYVPAVVDAVLQRGEFLTAYTPYQPEVSQGTLQAIYEFQTMIAELTGMEIANASMYDGPLPGRLEHEGERGQRCHRVGDPQQASLHRSPPFMPPGAGYGRRAESVPPPASNVTITADDSLSRRRGFRG